MTEDDIEGWFDDDFRAVYREQVDRVASPAVFVEIGCWKGKSTVGMARLIRKSGKAIRFVAVDHCKGSPGESEPSEGYGGCAPTSEEELRGNLEGWDVELVVSKSVPAAEGFEEGSVDFVFIDGDHREAGVWADVTTWWGKVKGGGVMAGHDRGLPGVDRAVCRFAAENRLYVAPRPSCWVIRKG